MPGSRQYPDRPILGVGAIILDGDWILLVERGREPLKGYWSLPGGMLETGETLSSTHEAMAKLMADRGVDRMFGRRLYSRLRALGLAEVGAEGRTFMWPAGSVGPSLMRANYQQLRADMVASGYVTEREFEHDVAYLDDADFLMPSPVLWAAWGRRGKPRSHERP